jgi:hypothetical protein
MQLRAKRLGKPSRKHDGPVVCFVRTAVQENVLHRSPFQELPGRPSAQH